MIYNVLEKITTNWNIIQKATINLNSYPIALGSKQTYSLKDNLYATGDFHLMTRIVLELLPTQCDSNVSPSLGPPTLKEKKLEGWMLQTRSRLILFVPQYQSEVVKHFAKNTFVHHKLCPKFTYFIAELLFYLRFLFSHHLYQKPNIPSCQLFSCDTQRAASFLY